MQHTALSPVFTSDTLTAETIQDLGFSNIFSWSIRRTNYQTDGRIYVPSVHIEIHRT